MQLPSMAPMPLINTAAFPAICCSNTLSPFPFNPTMFSSQITLLVSHLLLILAPPALCQFPNPPAVLTPQGIYYPNTTLPDIDQFLGIPYAAPPIGPLRFAAPAPYTSGSPRNVVNATSYGPGCLQNPSLSHPNGLSEDCLTLNIFRPTTRTPTHPHKPPPLLPVLVFIYGGANIGSQARLFAAPNLAAHALRNTSTPILTCTLNYRTGALAFLPSRLFARARLLNAGLKDQRAALQWLHANIAAFGGDPRRVVIFGQSAGSFDAWMQARYAARDAPADRPFAGAILESGAPASLALKGLEPSAGDAYLQASLRAFGCPAACEGSAASDARVLACLRGVGAERLVRKPILDIERKRRRRELTFDGSLFRRRCGSSRIRPCLRRWMSMCSCRWGLALMGSELSLFSAA